jgi:hypothetical protein
LRPHISHDNLADATRQCEFTFGTYGLVILDADDADLKRPFIPLQKKNYYTKLPIKQYLKQPKKIKVQHKVNAKSICFISKIK